MSDHQVLPNCVQVNCEDAWCMSRSECCRCAMAFSAACRRHMMVQYCCGSGSTSKLVCMCFSLRQEANEVILNVCLYYVTLEGTRLLELHWSVYAASWMSHHELIQTLVCYCSQFLTKQKRIKVWQLLFLSGIY